MFHRLRGANFPISKEIFKRYSEGVAQSMAAEGRLGRGPKQALPFEWLLLTARHIHEVVVLNPDLDPLARLRAHRDCIILIVGFFAALRPSEICSIDVEHLSFDSGDDGNVWLMVPWSKTDPRRRGTPVGLAALTDSGVPIRAMIIAFIDAARSYFGSCYTPDPAEPTRGTPLICDTRKAHNGSAHPRALLSGSRMVTETIRLRVLHALDHAAKHWGYRGPIPDAKILAASSLRRGMATWMESRGLSEEERMQHGRWLSAVNRRYVEWVKPRTGTLTQRC